MNILGDGVAAMVMLHSRAACCIGADQGVGCLLGAEDSRAVVVRILLFDHATDGHHLEYAGYLSNYLTGVGDDVTFATSGKPLEWIEPSVTASIRDIRYLDCASLIRLPSSAARYTSVARCVDRCLRLASHERVDVVHFLYVDRCELAILMSLHRQSRPAAVFGTLFWPYFVHEGLEQLSWGKQLFHSVNQRALNRLLSRGIMSGLFVHSERIRTLVAERLSGPSIRDRISVVPDPAKEAPPITHEEAREALGLPATDPVLLFFGGARPDKGPDILLKVLPELAGDWVTVFAGAAGAVGEAEAEACRRALPDPGRLVTRFGYVPEAEADRYFRAADVVILPYRRAFKGTSGILRRAAAYGKPVIATDVGDVGPTVREAGLGVVIPPESAVHLAAALRDFLEHRVQVTSAVEPRALEYARANDWRVLGSLTREKYLAALESQQQSQSELRGPPTRKFRRGGESSIGN